jgi:hypothetical protein
VFLALHWLPWLQRSTRKEEEAREAEAPLVRQVVERLWAAVQALVALRRRRMLDCAGQPFNGYLGVDFAWLYEQSIRRFAFG